LVLFAAWLPIAGFAAATAGTVSSATQGSSTQALVRVRGRLRVISSLPCPIAWPPGPIRLEHTFRP
jgi:hypothetical protein